MGLLEASWGELTCRYGSAVAIQRGLILQLAVLASVVFIIQVVTVWHQRPTQCSTPRRAHFRSFCPSVLLLLPVHHLP